MSGTLVHLQPHEQEAVSHLATCLIETTGYRLVGLWLFGSKTRGDFQVDSDLDILIILREVSPELRWQVRRMASECSLLYDVLFNTHILEQSRWEQMVSCQDTLWKAICRDGVSLIVESAVFP